MALQMSESYVNLTTETRYGDSGWYEPYTQDRGQLFRSLQREYGRCTSKVYRDVPGKAQPETVGWCFVKRVEYDDARASWTKEQRTYLREVWVTLRAVADDDEAENAA